MMRRDVHCYARSAQMRVVLRPSSSMHCKMYIIMAGSQQVVLVVSVYGSMVQQWTFKTSHQLQHIIA